MREGWRIAGLVVRIVLLLALLGGALVVALSLSPSPRTLPEFRAALAAGRVSSVEYRTSTPEQETGEIYELTWSEGPLIWHRIDRTPVGDGQRSYTVERLGRDAAAVARVDRKTGTSSRGLIRWPFEVPPRLGLGWVGLAWGLTFLIMLGSTPRLGNRWAWFWMFTAGQIGALAFLLLEPRPLWYRRGRRPRPTRRLGGGTGCLMSILLSVVAVAAAMGVGELARRVLG
ncbi:hypothetical protein [Streptosporangium carneum]|uniref:hypothetical protein n=1 Tax=Streptosporangium carneum TaxID=47481 RepID=UPI0022F2C970|nr:hypothetical protein [Streptosporangium carneum]